MKKYYTINKLTGIFLLAFLSHLFLDGFLWGHFTTNPLSLRRIFYNTLMRAAIAEWFVSHVAGVQSFDSFMIRGRSIVLAVLIYGPPLVTILYYLLDVNPFFWGIKIPETLVPSTVQGLIGWIISALIYDFTRLILFIKLKTILLPSGKTGSTEGARATIDSGHWP